MYGYTGKILRVNLTNKKVSIEPTEKLAKRFIGGRGINEWILFDEVSPETKWFNPETLITFGIGVLVGTLVPGACRMSIDTKNVFTGGIGSSNVGGHFPSEVKYAGFDNIVVSGRAEKPVFLWIRDGDVEVKDASTIWGRNTYETEEMIKKDFGDRNIKVASIGPAGENLVKPSCIIVDKGKAAGGSGVGAVMGSKKLKAIAVRGTGGIKVAEPERFIKCTKKLYEHIRRGLREPAKHRMMEEGLWVPVTQQSVESGLSPVRNGQDDYWPPERLDKILFQNFKGYAKKRFACFCCRGVGVPFWDLGSIKGWGFQGNVAMSWAFRFDIDNPESIIRNHLLCNQLGLDGDNSAVVLSWAFECYEHGIITKRDTDGLALTWGNHEAVTELLMKLAYREGIGNLLAEGVKAAAEKTGKDSQIFAVYQPKGQDSLDGYRVAKSWSFGIATAPNSGRHLRGAWGQGLSFPKTLEEIHREKRILGVEVNPFKYENQEKICFFQEKYKAIIDSLGLCMPTWPVEWFAELFTTATGIKRSSKELMRIGRRIHNIEKAFNTLHRGFTRKHDYPPRRYLEEPVKSGPNKGMRCDRNEWDELLDKYYALHGWDKETSWQTGECLKELGLPEVAEKLRQIGRLKQEKICSKHASVRVREKSRVL